ncbi:hypothetical protein GCM10008906_03010 [Clostridium oceanicum]|uniref:Uncharacterized protein n=1 Tax=Clostridium oceanicum TaxID=1543 RepID=A0ABP3UFR2_9CLOT
MVIMVLYILLELYRVINYILVCEIIVAIARAIVFAIIIFIGTYKIKKILYD